MHSAKLQVNYIAVAFDWFDAYNITETKKVCDCFIAWISSDFCKITCLECDLGDTEITLANL